MTTHDPMDREELEVDSTRYETEIPRRSLRPFPGLPDRREVRAFIPGTIVEVRAREGERVSPGQVLLLLDAMKMHNEVCSEIQGRVRSVMVRRGDRVEKNQILVSLEECQ
ncbi:acetyl-CoA carboxylase biotin carboxyl carrier protein subunit [Candidatus Fermentibacteria bacterium]|nr:acetyl-CoA carboxylase biotin carboxyl carrier protein subunit [Candidatus Fermentibacteria bacterium]